MSKITESNPQVLMELYKTRVQLMISQGDRSWTRFNYFLGIELALAGLYFTKYYNYFAVIGLLFSIVWFIIGAQDNYYLRMQRKKVDAFENDVLKQLTNVKFNTISRDPFIKQYAFSFMIPYFNVTPFLAYLPLLLVAFWGVMCFY